MGLLTSWLPILSLVAAAGFFLLFLLARRRRRTDPATVVESEPGGSAMALAAVPLGPLPVLEPAAIFRQVLWDPAEVAPVWVRPPTEPESSATETPDPALDEVAASPLGDTVSASEDGSPADKKPIKRTRRPKAEGSATRKARKGGKTQPPT